MKKIQFVTICFALQSLVFVFIPLWGESQNLLRNPSFESGTVSKPTSINQLHYCNQWRTFDAPNYGGTSDWFQDAQGKLRGSLGCGNQGGSHFNDPPHMHASDGTHFAGMIRNHAYADGEGIQQKLSHKLDFGYYQLNFDYFLPCDTMWYRFKLYLGSNRDQETFFGGFIDIPTVGAGTWQSVSHRFFLPIQWDRQLDWFILLFDGKPLTPPLYIDAAYIYVDDFDFRESPCTSCDPNGLISWNNESIRPYFTPDGDGVFDEWCVSNINNVSWYEFKVVDRWGVTVYEDKQSNPNGFENLSLCWDGRNNNGQMLNVGNDYQILVRLGNCGTQITHLYQVWSSNDLAHNVFSVAQNYVPPLFGLDPSPTHYRDLHLYGGPYYGTHDWYACDSIIIGIDGAPRVPYFWAASTCNLGFHFGAGFDTHLATDFRIDPGADIDIVPEPVQCCPAMRLANPNLSDPEVSDIGELSETEDPIDPEENGSKILDNPLENEFDDFSLHVYPVPATDFLKIDFYLPSKSEVKATLTSTSGIVISEILQSELLEAGDHSYSISVRSIPDGMYFLQLSRSSGVTTVKVIVQR
jgi:gliding motility-associated-like protein